MKKLANSALAKLFGNAGMPAKGSVKKHGQNIFDELRSEVEVFCDEHKGTEKHFHLLRLIRNGLKGMTERRTVMSKQMKREMAIFERVVALLDCEIALLNKSLGLDIFAPAPASAPARKRKSASVSDEGPLAIWDGLIAELEEYFIPLKEKGKLLHPSSRKPMGWPSVVKLLKKIFGVDIRGEYDRKTDVIKRDYNTVFIDEMRDVMIELGEKYWEGTPGRSTR